ncbi:YijD family membrane protein [Aliivibrio fischeri]|uniref:YijD family membrane protein n=1 Tax=Aliivibrio fischeri TaxID=668 RepID=UPI0007C4BD7A|nr:YijD family membrane protein [Aliivibrio fischeri]MBP3140343.1 YijD family membrane protein [Aliivibrio fischeri]MBP3156339.1 YijD family membrane protein [Aliivibrio fischeri]MCE7537638.1 YijD family membrane protein [Aliivibrio fischeri]MCE7560178.1 YijD family membrane protein [Aliivibrio fischeri]MCE7575351.1 YijD family membrane protein [Aliivibrio fischeri]
MTHENSRNERKTLVLSVVAGLCLNAVWVGLTVTEVAFSIFPIIALVLAAQGLYQEYLRPPVSEDTPLIAVACFFVGLFGHSALVKAQYPEAGSNFFSILVALALLLWIGVKMGILKKKDTHTEL